MYLENSIIDLLLIAAQNHRQIELILTCKSSNRPEIAAPLLDRRHYLFFFKVYLRENCILTLTENLGLHRGQAFFSFLSRYKV